MRKVLGSNAQFRPGSPTCWENKGREGGKNISTIKTGVTGQSVLVVFSASGDP